MQARFARAAVNVTKPAMVLKAHRVNVTVGIRIGFAEKHHDQIAMAAVMRPGDLAIAISFSGCTRPTLKSAKIARSHEATVAAVLGVPDPPLPGLADIPIITLPGISLSGPDAVMTRMLELMFDEVVLHRLVSRHPDLLAMRSASRPRSSRLPFRATSKSTLRRNPRPGRATDPCGARNPLWSGRRRRVEWPGDPSAGESHQGSA